MTEQTEAQRLADELDNEYTTGRISNHTGRKAAAELHRLETELERERMRLAACDVIACADTPETAAQARQMRADYKSAASESVARRVDECIKLRSVNAEMLGALKSLEKEFREIYPIYYSSEPWGHETNVPLLKAQRVTAKATGETK
jgi:purine nucleoside phosphorylase